jgi:hypothetical protein
MLMASTIPSFHTPTPWEEVVDEAVALAGRGGVVGVIGEPVFVAGVMPEGATIRHVNETNATVDALLVVHMAGSPPAGTAEIGPYRLVRTWNASFLPSPALAARIWIEENLLAERYRFVHEPTVSLYARA